MSQRPTFHTHTALVSALRELLMVRLNLRDAIAIAREAETDRAGGSRKR
ncbi:MAG: hypothetical protein JSS47_19720 [Proteobacteria bacterium]|nr:hypothetical protein [Pseudomonadota bacterium]